MAAAPADRAGAAAALSETATNVGGALGVAVLGSVGLAVYRHGMRAAVGVPAGDGVLASLGAAAAQAGRLAPGPAAALLDAARGAFARGLGAGMAVGAVLLAAAAAVAWRRAAGR